MHGLTPARADPCACGDLRWEGERTRFYFPFTTCVVISLFLMVLVRVLRVVLPRL